MLKTTITAGYLILLGIYDGRKKEVPIVWLAVGAAAALGYEVYLYASGICTWETGLTELLPSVLPGMLLLFLAGLTKKAGYADGVVILLLGILEGYKRGMVLFCVSMLLIAVFSGVLLLFRKRNGNSRIAYLPFVAAAYMIVALN